MSLDKVLTTPLSLASPPHLRIQMGAFRYSYDLWEINVEYLLEVANYSRTLN
jgi:hypothetical protein